MKEDKRSIEQLVDDARERCEEDAAKAYMRMKDDLVAFDNKVESSSQGARRSAQMQLDDHYVFYASDRSRGVQTVNGGESPDHTPGSSTKTQ